MLNPGSNRESDSLPVSASLGEFEKFPTLKQSLSASLASNFHHSPSKPNDFEHSPSHAILQPESIEESPSPLQDPAIEADNMSDVALAAMRHLPTPILVLSSSRTVVLASEPMKQLLPSYNTHEEGSEDPISREKSVTEQLHGKTLTDIGVGVIEDGHPIIVNWDKYLDGLISGTDELSQNTSSVSLQDVPNTPASPLKTSQQSSVDGANNRRLSSPRKKRMKPQSIVADVVLTSKFRAIHGGKHGFYMSDKQVRAKMQVGTWSLGNDQYYTLSFTTSNTPAMPLSAHSRKSSQISRPSLTPDSPRLRTNPTPAMGSPDPHPNGTPPTPSMANPSHDRSPLSAISSPLQSPISVDSPGLPSMTEKLSRMKDAILSSMQIPVFAMWKDESLVYPNEAGMRLMRGTLYGSFDDPSAAESRFTCWTEDFSRELEEDEYPINQLCRTENPNQKWRLGVKDPKRGCIIFDVTGEGIYDEKTGEFVAGMITMNDVTDYLGRIKLQSEQNEQQFQLICDTMPQLVSRNASVQEGDKFLTPDDSR